MGGNAIRQKKFNSTRANKKEYNEVKEFVNQILSKEFYVIPPEYKDKEDFGDIDVLIEHHGTEHIKEIVDKFLRSEKIDGFNKNKSLYSLAYRLDTDRYFQIDLIFVTPNNFEGSSHYLSYNDLFNIMGRLAKKIGGKLSHKGLEYVVRRDDKIEGTITLTSNFRKVFEVLDLNYNRFLSGFNTREEVFKYVIESRYFCKDDFNEEKFSLINRKRMKKRPGFEAFVEFTKSLPDKECVQKDKMTILKYFPDVETKVQELIERAEIKKRASKKFNGNIVKEVLGIEGKELGNFMKKFKQEYDYRTISAMNDNEIKDLINGFFKQFQ